MLELDKQLHFFAGGMIVGLGLPLGTPTAILLLFLAAVGKEAWDACGNGTPDRWDAIATIAGGMLVVLWYVLMS